MKKILPLFSALMLLLANNSSAQTCTPNFTVTNTSTSNNLQVTFTNLNPNPSLPAGAYANYWASYPGYKGYITQSTQAFNLYTPGTYTFYTAMEVKDTATNNTLCIDSVAHTVTFAYGTPCVSFITYGVSSSNNKVTFYAHTPTPNAGMTYTWNFGDGTTGTGTNVTHGYQTSGTRTVTLTATDGSCTYSTSITKYFAAQNLPCSGSSASIYSTSNGLSSYFASTSPSVPGYTMMNYWNLGDGTMAYSNNINHIYQVPGVYNITLITTWTQGQLVCNDTATQAITISTSTNNKIRGWIFPDSTYPLPSNPQVKVWLIKQDTINGNLHLNAIDSQFAIIPPTVPNGLHYEFSNAAPSWSYLVKAAFINNASSGYGNIPTYHYSALTWDSAGTFAHLGGFTSKNITMRSGVLTNGPGFVGGNVAQGANKGTANGINEMTVLLFDNNGNLIKGVLTDAVGDYSFGNLPTGIYKVYPEDAGYNTTPVTINISNNNSSITGINFTRSYSKRTITPAPNSIANLEEELIPAIYPNPAKNNVTIRWNGKLSEQAAISITDVTGKKVIAERVNTNGATNINVSTLQSGMYFITISSEHIQHIQKLTIQ